MHESGMPDTFDRYLGQFHGLPNTMNTEDSTVRTVPPLGVGGTHIWVIRTYRQRDVDNPKAAARDTVFLERHGSDAPIRLVIPPEVTRVINRQRDRLTQRSHSKAGKARAADAKKRGITPFVKKSK